MKQLYLETLDYLSQLDELVVQIKPKALAAVRKSHVYVMPHQICVSLGDLHNIISKVRSDIISYCMVNDILTSDEIIPYISDISQFEKSNQETLSNQEIQELIQLIDAYTDKIGEMNVFNVAKATRLVNPLIPLHLLTNPISAVSIYLGRLKMELSIEPVKIMR